jgi:CHAD domain-containing protein
MTLCAFLAIDRCVPVRERGTMGRMQTATETERKYDVPESFDLPPLTGIAELDGSATHDLDATYFDTEDLSLMRHRRTLRRRTGGEDAGWHLKTPGDGTSRTEHRLPLSGDEVPDELAGLVRAIIRRRPLRPVARLRTHRVETPLRDAEGRTLALIAQDRVTAEVDGGEPQVWQEIEVELVDGDAALLDAVQERLLAAGATPAAGPSKVGRALGGRLAEDRPGKSPGKNKINPVLRYGREQRDAINEYDPGVRAGDPEAVHKMRVATRRLRSTLKTFKRSFPDDAADLGDELKCKLLADVEAAGPDFDGAAERIRAHLEAQVERGRADLERELNGERYLTLLDRIDQLADDPADAEDDPLKRARKSLAKADGLLDTALAGGVDAELHDARKAYKRARYAVEVFEPVAGRPAKSLIAALTELQDVLGAHQDSVVARELLHEIGPDSFQFGVLWARQELLGRDTHAQLPVVVETSRKKKLRKWLG